MRPRFCLFAAYLCTAGLVAAQSTAGPAKTTGSSSSQSTSTSSSSSSSDKGLHVYVRRISAGATLSVLALTPVTGKTSDTTTNVNAATTLETNISSTGASSRIGYGVTVQAAITEHFAIAVGGFLRRLGYIESNTQTTTVTTFINGVPQTTTTSTSTRADVRARVVDVPLTVRWYG